MRSWIKSTLLVLLLFGVCWANAIWYWRDTNRLPSTADLVIYMLAVPFALLLAFWLGRKLFALTFAVPAVTVNAAPESSAPPAQQTVPPLAVLAAAVRTPHGASVDELAAAIESLQARASLDPELLDDDGFPVMSARVTEADDPAPRDDIAQWLAANGHPAAHFSDEQWRALTLASGVVKELAYTAANHTHLPVAQGGPQPPTLQLIALLPAEWQEAQRLAALAWLRHSVAQGGWPLERISASGPAQPVATLTQLARHSATSGEPVVALVLACGSHIAQASVEALRANLSTAARPQGVIPGEGAAGVLVADVAQAALIDTDPQPLLYCAGGVRDGSADQSRRPDAALLRKLTTHLLDSGAVEAAKVALLLSDASHRTSRVMEVMALAADGVAHLDTASEVQATGTACGHCGAVPFMAALALARHHAIERGEPILAVGVEDPFNRGAALIRPAQS